MPVAKPFYQRFDINRDHEEVVDGFINRLYSGIFDELIPTNNVWKIARLRSIGAKIGIMVNHRHGIQSMIDRDFHKCLAAIEALYEDASDIEVANISSKEFIDRRLDSIFNESEGDLGIEWRDGHFSPSGVKILDNKLVNEDLKWLHEKDLGHIYKPFEKALQDFSESISRPEKLRDVITGMYEALEATAKLVLGNSRDLSANREKFISNIGMNDFHQGMMAIYIDYANKLFRHAQDTGTKRSDISKSEAENFIYLTGIYIRFTIEKLKEIEDG